MYVPRCKIFGSTHPSQSRQEAQLFLIRLFLPSLLGYGEPAEALACHSVLITLYAVSKVKESTYFESHDGNRDNFHRDSQRMGRSAVVSKLEREVEVRVS